MKCDINKCKNYMSLIGRVLVGAFFVLSGIMKLMNPESVAALMASAGIPAAGVLVWIVIIFLIVTGGSLIAGRMVCLMGILLSIYVFIVTLLFHLQGDQILELLKNLALIGGLLFMAAACMDKKCCAPKKEMREDHSH